MRGLLTGCVLVAVVGCGKPEPPPDVHDLARKLKSKGIDVEVVSAGTFALFTEKSTGKRVSVSIAASEAKANAAVKNFEFDPASKWGAAFSKGRYVITVSDATDVDLIKRIKAALD